MDALEQAVALLPHDASNHANLGLALASSGRYDDAEPELKRALDLNPHSAMASQLLNAIERTKPERASRESQKISDSDPAAEAR